jgi:plastocyanin
MENQDDVDHNFVSTEAGLSEVVLAGNQRRTVEWTAPTQPGTYKLVCTYHRGMEMTVTVR